MLHRILLARIGLAKPPLTAAARDIGDLLLQLETHLANNRDVAGMELARRLHGKLHAVARTGMAAGAIEVGTFSATPKPEDD